MFLFCSIVQQSPFWLYIPVAVGEGMFPLDQWVTVHTEVHLHKWRVRMHAACTNAASHLHVLAHHSYKWGWHAHTHPPLVWSSSECPAAQGLGTPAIVCILCFYLFFYCKPLAYNIVSCRLLYTLSK